MTDIEKAIHIFKEAGLAFPTIPEELAVKLKERGERLFSTRKLTMSPYNLRYYVDESDGVDRLRPLDGMTLRHENDESENDESDFAPGSDYAVLCHSGHGVNSYAIQYYLVRGPLRMFLHLAWGGIYEDAKEAAAEIEQCFSLADQVVKAAEKLAAGERLTIVGSDFYGSYWSAQGEKRKGHWPASVLVEVIKWLRGLPPQQTGLA